MSGVVFTRIGGVWRVYALGRMGVGASVAEALVALKRAGLN